MTEIDQLWLSCLQLWWRQIKVNRLYMRRIKEFCYFHGWLQVFNWNYTRLSWQTSKTFLDLLKGHCDKRWQMWFHKLWKNNIKSNFYSRLLNQANCRMSEILWCSKEKPDNRSVWPPLGTIICCLDAKEE